MNRNHVLRLLMSVVFCAAMFGLFVLAITPQTAPPTAEVPTLMQLPGAPGVAILPTNSPAPTIQDTATLEPDTPAPAPSNTASATAVPSETAMEQEPAPTQPPVVVAPALAPAATFVPAEPIPEQVVIAFAPEASEAERAAYIAQIGGAVAGEIAALDTVIVSVPADVAAAPLPESPAVVQAEPDYVAYALAEVPNDPLYPQQWPLAAIGAADAWTTSRAPVTVAVIDSGICASHPDLAGRIVAGYDFLDHDDTPQDTFGHGCGISSIIAANTNDGLGMAGVAPNTRIMPLRVLNEQGVGPYSAVAAALVWAADHGAQIASLSLGGPSPSSVLEEAVHYAVSHGVTVVAAAGNSGSSAPVLYPAAYEPVISVGAFGSSGALAAFSSGGERVDVLAPGVGILMAALDGTYTRGNGTSFAAPHVAAAIAEGYVPAGQGAHLWLGSAEATPAFVSPTAAPTAEVTVDLAPYQALLDRAEAEGRVRVIVALDAAFSPEAALDAQSAQAQRSEIAAAQSAVISALAGEDAVVVAESQTWTIPYLALELDRDALIRLLNLPEVRGVEEDALLAPALNSSVPIVEADDAWAAGYDGTGQTIAILDTGVQTDHPFLIGKVVSEACYSSQGTTTVTLCSNGLTSQIGTGAASPWVCWSRGIGDGCSHGTHVAGIAAGINGSFSAQTYHGVARGATLIAIQVFSEVRDTTACGGASNCALAYTSNIISGLQRTYDLRGSYAIASANISIGGGSYSGFCDTQSIKSIIDQLKGVGIATVIASGNNSYTSSVSFPACVSTGVSVGATNDADAVASFSNSGPQLDLLAPGVSITSSVLPSTYSTWNGTSMAAPHVAGAWAILKQCQPAATVDQIQAALANTGQSVTDSRNGRVTPRIRINAALDWLDANVGCIVPPTATFTPTNTPVATATNTPSPLPNRVTNGDFSAGLNSWAFTSDLSRTVTGGALNVYRMNTSSWGGINQNVGFSPSPGQALEASFLLGNASSNPKTIRVYLNSNAGFGGAVMCSYVVPANTPLTSYRMIGPVGAAWTGQWTTFQFIIDTADNQAALLLDDVAVRWHTTNPGVSVTNCNAAGPAPTPTNTSTPTNTPTATNTLPPTATFTPSNTPTATHTPTSTFTPTNTAIPSNTPVATATNTPSPLPNRVTNGDFSAGLNSWAFTSDLSRTVTGGALNVYRMNTSSWGGINQNVGFSPSPGQALEASFLLGNASSNPKTIRVYLNSNAGFGGAVMCSYVVPANTPLTSYRMIGPVGAAWTGQWTTFQFIIDTADNQAALLLDDVAVRWHTTNPGVSVTNCNAAGPAPTPTNTSTPTNTPTATNTLPPTATFTPSNTPTATHTPTSTFTPTNTAIPSNTPVATATNTPSPLPNRVTNGDFSAGLNSWAFTSDLSRTVTGGALNVYRMNTSSWGGINQNVGFSPSPGQALEASFLLGNASSNPKTIRVYLNSNAGFGGAVMCSYVVPANTPLTSYRMIGLVGAAWTGQWTTFQFIIDTADNQAALLLDDVAVRWYATGVSLSATNCAWNGVLGGPEMQSGLIVATAMQLPGIPDGMGTLPPPPMTATPISSASPTASPEASATLAPPTETPTAVPTVPSNTPAPPTAIPTDPPTAEPAAPPTPSPEPTVTPG